MGFRVAALNELQPVTSNLLRQIRSAAVIEGDVGDMSVVRRLWEAYPEPSVFAAGVACQPYSRLGDRKGGKGARALSLPPPSQPPSGH